MYAPRTTRLFAGAALSMILGGACASDDRRDQYYGTDVGASWDAPAFVTRDAAVDAAASGDSGGGSIEAGAAAEVGVDGVSPDAPAAATDGEVIDATSDGRD